MNGSITAYNLLVEIDLKLIKLSFRSESLFVLNLRHSSNAIPFYAYTFLPVCVVRFCLWCSLEWICGCVYIGVQAAYAMFARVCESLSVCLCVVFVCACLCIVFASHF